MITVNEQPEANALRSIAEFRVGDTFKYKARFYLVVDMFDEEEELTQKMAIDLQSGERMDEHKRKGPALYPVDLVMRVVARDEEDHE